MVMMKFIRRIILFLIFGVLIFGALNQQRIADFVRASSFEPSVEMAGIISNIQLKDEYRTILLATSPQLQAAEDFNENCKNRLENTSVLGCYKSDSIFVFDIDDSRLDGIKEATTAHEALHAIWARHSDSERERLGELLRADYDRLKTDRLEKTMARYAISQPGEHENELHSILGTEFRNLSPELEQYYATIFENRNAVVAYFEKYNSKFEELKEKSEKISSELENLDSQIELSAQHYESELARINANIEDFNSRATSGGFSSVEQFYAERAVIVADGDGLEELRSKLNADIAEYNSKVAELKEISLQTQNLYEAIDSTAAQDLPNV